MGVSYIVWWFLQSVVVIVLDTSFELAKLLVQDWVWDGFGSDFTASMHSIK